MATLLLVRHGRTTANASGLLAGRTPGVRLDDLGSEQAARAGARIGSVPVVALVTSPQERCKQTAKAIGDAQRASGHATTRAVTEKALAECDYGEWQGRPIKELLREPLWTTVQRQPSAAVFPGGESMVAMQHRAVAAVRRLDAAVTEQHGADAVWVAVSHGDIIKSVLADALGMHLDLFQRINVDPASVSVIRYAPDRPYVLATNTHDGDLSWLAPRPGRKRRGKATGAVVGGGAGPGPVDH
ncbi:MULTISPECIES: histidine phosphatase family protein [unclassified Nocardioides]|uniref:histidine phosphatase family protein n=1 Tax=unclassified Nocardioides TaxID=2615069 RepID=UPI0011541847|nr:MULTISPECIES: histidine phosphatase family protein [unclassified Nocardioides]TQK71077.1 putative phosphomutase (TIGR03848 family) [Nocardioides sp. SLBN-35]WGY04738.1 histidine phosphatase family protein [Nocardioides sp. QY071]